MLKSSHGFQNMLKEGYRHYSGLEEAIMKNIEACKDIAKMCRTSLGPNGMKKMVINYLEKIIVTSDAATMLKELEVQHPAAKMLVTASQMQENECGDNTNFVITLAGELLEQAESLIKMGLHSSLIISGYETASEKSIELLEEMKGKQVSNLKDEIEISKCLKSSISSKLPKFNFLIDYQKKKSYDEFFSNLIAKACIMAMPKNKGIFDLEHIRVTKLLGGNITDSQVMRGLVVMRNVEGSIHKITNARIAVYGCPLDTQTAETKGTVVIKKAEELLNYTKTEEENAERIAKEIADSKVNVVICGGSIQDIMLHFLEKYKILLLKITSKFELRRICRAINASALVRLGGPTEEEIGYADEVSVQEIGSQNVTVIKKDNDDCKLSTIVVRGSTNNLLDDIERAVDDGINVFKALLKDDRFVPGAGTAEIILSSKLQEQARKITGLDQYSYEKFALAFECIPRILSENAGMNANDIISKLYTENSKAPTGIDIQNKQVKSSEELEVWDHLRNKKWAIQLASDVAITILRIDQIIMAKPAGGPKVKDKNPNWDED